MSQIDCDTEHDEIKQLGTITGQDIGEDFIIFPIEVPMYVTMKVVQDEGGELKPELVAKLSRKTKKPKMRTLPLILHPSGVPLLVENLFLRYLMQEEIRNDESLERLAIGLLGFCRFCHASEWLDDSGNSAPMTYRSLCHDPEEGAPWLYGDFLFDNLHKRDPSTGIVVEEGYAPSTAKFNIRVVARFYAWLLDMGYITFNEDYKAFNEKYIELRRRGDKDSQSSGADKKMLSHTFSGSGNGYKRMIRTSDFLKRFTDVAAMSDIEEWKKLNPMSPRDKALFDQRLKQDFGSTKALMCELSCETGLRLKELITFPEDAVYEPLVTEKTCKVTIGPEFNGCLTKYRKQRTIEVPYEMMVKLYEYKLSDKRQDMLERHGIEVDDDFDMVEGHGRLFITERTPEPYTKSTIQRYFSDMRDDINDRYSYWVSVCDELTSIPSDVMAFHESERSGNKYSDLIPRWYQRPHDMRATFATNWLIRNHTERKKPLRMLMEELADLMGHSSTDQTEKYVNFLTRKIALFKSASAKNRHASQLY